MNKLKKILVAVDFSPNSADAFRQAERIASWNLAALTAVHAVDPMLTPWPPPDPFFQVPLPGPREMVAEARQDWLRFVPDVEVQTNTPLAVVVESPRQAILNRVREDAADLLVLGSHSTHDVQRGVGTIAAGCMRASPVPVLAVRLGQTGAFHRILACIDFSPTSLDALDAAVRIGSQDGASLYVLHVYQDPWLGLMPPKEIQDNMPDFNAQYRRAVEARLRDFYAPLAHELGAMRAEYHCERAGNGRGIVPFADQCHCDLVILGTRGKWSVRDFLMGSTAERVAREAQCSVLAMPPRKPIA